MKLPDPILPQNPDAATLTRRLNELMRQVQQQVNNLSDGRVSAVNNAQSSVPTTGTWQRGDFVLNTAPTPLGEAGNQYIIDGWKCVYGGTPGTWVEYRVSVGTPPATAPAATPAPTPAPAPSAYSQKIQAEDATLHNIIVKTDIAGYEGTGYADWFRSGYDEYLEFGFTSAPASSGNLTLRYANFGDQTVTVSVNGAAGTMYTFTDSGGTWTTKVISSVTFTSGTNTVKLTPDNSGYTYFDYAKFDQLTGAPPPPPPPPPAPAPSSPAPAPAPAPGAAPHYPFGSRLDLTASAYPYGIQPNGSHTTTTMDAAVKACYDSWRLARLAKSPTFVATSGIYAGQTITDGYHVDFGTGVEACRSEGIGYGMLITVVMAGYDTNAQTYFDGLYKVARGRPAYGMPTRSDANVYLHEWRLLPDMSSGGGGYNASDGDMDIALALLMAHRQWGSSGAINYYNEALNTIAAMKAVNFATNGLQFMPQNVSRVSDYMPGHFRAFKAATTDTFWDDARTNSLALAQSITSRFSPTAKLQPGFIYDPLGSAPRPDNTARVDRSGYEDIYDGNSVRNPWRWATDYVWSGDTGWKGLTNDIVTTLKASSGGSASGFSWAYDLAGNPQSNLYHDKGQAGCVMAGCMVDSANQTFLNTLFSANTGSGFSTLYYQGELQLLPLIVASGNWWRP
jgi:hypothetical protein